MSLDNLFKCNVLFFEFFMSLVCYRIVIKLLLICTLNFEIYMFYCIKYVKNYI